MVRAAIISILFLSACATTEPQIVRVPVSVDREVPQALLEPLNPPSGPVFISPTDKKAVVGLSKEGVQALVMYIDELRTRLEAFKAWAKPE